MADRADDERLVLRVFTHPACSACSRAVQGAWDLGQAHPAVEVRTVRLEEKEGLTEAQAEGVKTIPTLILAAGTDELDRWIGLPERGVLELALERMQAGA